MGNDDHVSPSWTCVSGIADHTICDRVNPFTAIGVASGIFIPIFAKMILLAKIQSAIPLILLVACLGYVFFFADWVRKFVGDRNVGSREMDRPALADS
jgi:hypothetical protein